MTTDITELEQRMKAAAEKTTDSLERLKAFPGDELIDLSQHEGEQVDIDIATINAWYELTNPANIKLLVEELERTELRLHEVAVACATAEQELDLEREKSRRVMSRITELESRAVAAENLQESAYRAGLTAGWNFGLTNNSGGFNKCLAAHSTAGIKWEAE
ncbi:TPA: hypothetical protein ACGATL_000255 [Raoultella ornithinolytica]